LGDFSRARFHPPQFRFGGRVSAVIAPRRFLCMRSDRTDTAMRSGREAISGELLKTGLDEVPVEGERMLQTALPHDDKRNTVCQGE